MAVAYESVCALASIGNEILGVWPSAGKVSIPQRPQWQVTSLTAEQVPLIIYATFAVCVHLYMMSQPSVPVSHDFSLHQVTCSTPHSGVQ